MNKKKILIIVGIVLGVLLIGMGVTYGIHLNKENKKVYSVITIDVNPSLELGLNKKDKVVEVKALNEDAKVIKEEDLKGKEIDKAIDIVVDKLEDKIKDNTILINVESENKELNKKVEKEVKEVLEEKKIESEVIVQSIKVTEEIKKIAEENNISESKASYVLEQIKDVEGIEIKDVIEKNIEEVKVVVEEKIEEIKKREEEKEKEEAAKKEAEEKKQQTTKTTQQTQQSNQTTTKPAKQQSSSGKAGTGNMSYDDYRKEGMMEGNELKPIFFKRYGITDGSNILGAAFNATNDSRCKYNMAVEVEIIDGFYKHTAIMCQFVGDTYNYKKTKLVSSTITEEKAYEIALNRFIADKNIDPNGIVSKRINLGYNNATKHLYEYNVYMVTATEGTYAVVINATNGAVLTTY